MDADDLTPIADALHWLNAAQVQAERFLDAFASRRTRRPGRIEPDDWRSGFYSVEAQFLVVAMGHRVTSLDRLPDVTPAPRLSPDVRTATELLRNILEHWDEQRAAFSSADATKEKSGKRFYDLFPEFSPWSFGTSNQPAQGTRIGGAFHVERALDELRRIEQALVPLWVEALHEVGLLPYRGPIADFAPPGTAMPRPEDVAVASFEGRAKAALVIIEDSEAVVLAVADTDPASGADGCPWWIVCSRDPGGWICAGGGNGSGGWTMTDPETGRGVAFVGGRAPEGADAARIRFRGETLDVRGPRRLFRLGLLRRALG